MRAYVLVNVRGGEAAGVARELRGSPGVVRADFVFGTYDVIVEVEGKDVATHRAPRLRRNPCAAGRHRHPDLPGHRIKQRGRSEFAPAV